MLANLRLQGSGLAPSPLANRSQSKGAAWASDLVCPKVSSVAALHRGVVVAMESCQLLISKQMDLGRAKCNLSCVGQDRSHVVSFAAIAGTFLPFEACAASLTVTGVTFSDELGGLVLERVTGEGSLHDPFVIAERIDIPTLKLKLLTLKMMT
jgi:hypothetical protein